VRPDIPGPTTQTSTVSERPYSHLQPVPCSIVQFMLNRTVAKACSTSSPLCGRDGLFDYQAQVIAVFPDPFHGTMCKAASHSLSSSTPSPPPPHCALYTPPSFVHLMETPVSFWYINDAWHLHYVHPTISLGSLLLFWRAEHHRRRQRTADFMKLLGRLCNFPCLYL